MKERKKQFFLMSVIVLAAALCYGQVVSHSWLNWDDNWLITGNDLLARPGLNTVRQVFFDFSRSTRYALGAEYLPVFDVSIMVGRYLWKDWAGGFLLVNLLLYVASLLLIFPVTRRLTGRGETAFWATLLFAVHPVHVESVAWASSRKDVLCLLFFFAAFLFFERFLVSRRGWELLLSAAFYLLALMSKYFAVVLPAFILLRVVLLPVPGGKRRGGEALLPFIVISALFFPIILSVGEQFDMAASPIADDPAVVVLTMSSVLGRYLYNLLLPLSLSPVYPVAAVPGLFTAPGIGAALFALSFVLLLAAVTAATVRRSAGGRRNAPFLLWLLWFLAALLPVSQIFPIQNKMADRYLLFASWPYALMLVCLGRRLAGTRRLGPLMFRCAASGYIVFLLYQCYTLTGHWRDSVSLWEHAARVEPGSEKALYQLAVAYRDEGRFLDETAVLTRLLQLNPKHEQGLNNYGINVRRSGGPAPAAAVYSYLLSLYPGNPRALQNYGYLLTDLDRHEEAVHVLRRAVALSPGYCVAHNTLGRALLGQGNVSGAQAHFRQALYCNPDLDKARRNLEKIEESGGGILAQ